jgi:methionine sulfoxide reductase catalytic subunit
MLIKKGTDIPWSEIAAQSVYMNRRKFLISAAAAAGAASLVARPAAGWLQPNPVFAAGMQLGNLAKSTYSSNEAPTPREIVTTYNNFYEFGDKKDEPSRNSGKFQTSPWSVSIEGEVAKPRTFTMDEILKLAPLEERIYRHRCVEGWSIVVPWIGYSLNVLVKLVQPTYKARYVAFQSYYDQKQMPLARSTGIRFPYVEGLRLDEAMHPLALLCVGMYGETLPNQDGAPVRMVIPWKYGFKSAKSLVRIRFVADEPPTTWDVANSYEYGFYANVNPKVDDPRYSQATEVRLGGSLFGKKINTLMFNGYDQVASLYAGMDLRKYY